MLAIKASLGRDAVLFNTLRRTGRLCAILCWSLSLIGCVTGRPFDMSLKDQIVKGKTTREEVVELFGDPYKSTKSPGGIEAMEYYHKKRTMLNESTREQQGSTVVITPHFSMTGVATSLIIYLKNGVVSDVVGGPAHGW